MIPRSLLSSDNWRPIFSTPHVSTNRRIIHHRPAQRRCCGVYVIPAPDTNCKLTYSWQMRLKTLLSRICGWQIRWQGHMQFFAFICSWTRSVHYNKTKGYPTSNPRPDSTHHSVYERMPPA